MTQYSIPENLAVSDSGFLFLATTGETFTLNETGREIFKLMQQNHTREEIFSLMLDKFEIDRISLERDFEDFSSQLSNYGLIRTV